MKAWNPSVAKLNRQPQPASASGPRDKVRTLEELAQIAEQLAREPAKPSSRPTARSIFCISVMSVTWRPPARSAMC